jgi:hypothetical protein
MASNLNKIAIALKRNKFAPIYPNVCGKFLIFTQMTLFYLVHQGL